MQKVKFAKPYDHTWPSRAVTAFPAGWEGQVKDEVASAAKAADALEGEPVKDQPTSEPPKPGK